MLAEDDATATQLACYVYGVVRGDVLDPGVEVPGVDPTQRVRTVREGRVAALISAVAYDEFDERRLREQLGDMEWVERTALAHESVVDEISGQVTLVPMRMCTVYRTEDGVREMLRREAGALEEALVQLDGKAEWGVKVFADPERVRAAQLARARAAESAGPGARTARERATGAGAAYLQRRQRERDAVEEAELQIGRVAGEIHDSLCAIAKDGLVSPPQRPQASGHPGDMVLNGVYLVHADDTETFIETVSDIRADAAPLGLEIVVTGPWPAYNFVPAAIGAMR